MPMEDKTLARSPDHRLEGAAGERADVGCRRAAAE
jgi:hypothetical protein